MASARVGSADGSVSLVDGQLAGGDGGVAAMALFEYFEHAAQQHYPCKEIVYIHGQFPYCLRTQNAIGL